MKRRFFFNCKKGRSVWMYLQDKKKHIVFLNNHISTRNYKKELNDHSFPVSEEIGRPRVIFKQNDTPIDSH